MNESRVKVVPYDPRWPSRFAQLGAALRASLGDTALRIDHIGSTAISGLASKPTIDIQISVVAFDPLEAYRLPLEKLGHLFRVANPDLTKRYFRAAGSRHVHIHVRRSGSWGEQFSLLFRDYLRTHSREAERYATVKSRLAEKYRADRRGYTVSKAPVIWDIMKKADQWSQEVGWQPGARDA